jgi:hypothetical protein
MLELMATDEMAYKLWTKAFARAIKYGAYLFQLLNRKKVSCILHFRGFEDLTGKEHLVAATQTSATKYVPIKLENCFNVSEFVLTACDFQIADKGGEYC